MQEDGTMLDRIEAYLPDRLALARRYRWYSGKVRFFYFPTTFTELLQRSKLAWKDPLRAQTADKVAVRDYVRETIGAEYLIPLITVLEGPEDLDLAKLPDAFILKAAHGSGMNFVVRDKSEVSEPKLRELVRAWQARDFSREMLEWHYGLIPRRVAVEELLLEDGQPPTDYKLHMFHGEVGMIQVDTARYAEHTRTFFTPQWEELAVTIARPRSPVPAPRPALLEEMLAVAKKLAAPFEFVRMDLYVYRGRVLFGEATHTPGGGASRHQPAEFNRVLGDLWRFGQKIPERYLLKAAED